MATLDLDNDGLEISEVVQASSRDLDYEYKEIPADIREELQIAIVRQTAMVDAIEAIKGVLAETEKEMQRTVSMTMRLLQISPNDGWIIERVDEGFKRPKPKKTK